MRKLTTMILLLTVIVVSSCSVEDPSMRITDTSKVITITGKKTMIVKNSNDVHTPFEPSVINIQYDPKDIIIYIDNNMYEVMTSTSNTITFLTGNSELYVIEFNTGYIYRGNKTETKFDIYKANNKTKEYTVYTYNN